MKISIIIPVHNQFDLLDDCLQSIIKNTNKEYEIILSDSNSNRQLRDYYTHLDFSKRIKNLKIVEDNDKPGFSRAVNNGMKAASNDSDFYVWLNSDTLVIKGWLNNLKKDLCSPISNHASYQTVLQIDKKDLNLVEEFLQKEKFKPLNVSFLNGFCYIVSNEVFKTIGFLDEQHFPNYASEDDYTLRAKLKSYKAWILPNNFVYHYGNRSYQTDINSQIRNADKLFLTKYPKDWFNSLVTTHTIQTRNLRHDVIEKFVIFMKGKYDYTEKTKKTKTKTK